METFVVAVALLQAMLVTVITVIESVSIVLGSVSHDRILVSTAREIPGVGETLRELQLQENKNIIIGREATIGCWCGEGIEMNRSCPQCRESNAVSNVQLVHQQGIETFLAAKFYTVCRGV
jgi:hypothetical protein